MAPGDPERPDRPEYNVYRSGSRGRGRGRRAEQPREDATGAPPPPPEAPSPGPKGSDREEGAGYTVYRGGRRFGRSGDSESGTGGMFGGLRGRFGNRGGGGMSGKVATEGGFPWRRILKWGAIAVGAWLALSLVLFCISAQIQKGKLDDGVAGELGGFPLMLFSGQTILVMGTDVRPEGVVADESGTISEKKCVEAAGNGSVAPSGCTPVRADTLMLVRAGGGSFEKLSIPRDTLAAIPGQSDQKINAAFAFGGAELQVKTVEDFLGIDIDHVVMLDFAGFADFIDSLGGVQVDLPQRVHAQIDGGGAAGGTTLKLDQGKNDLTGTQALALARARKLNNDASFNDGDRARTQQLILQGIQSRITSPTRIPYNLIHAPWIAWNAPKAMVSDMGALTLPQLVLSAAIGGNSDTKILKPTSTNAAGDLIVPKRHCEKAVEEFLGKEGPRPPQCSPGG